MGQLKSDLIGSGSELFWDIRFDDGDWEGKQIVLSVTSAAAVQLARRMLDLAGRNVSGAHIHIDKADIATETDHQLVIALHQPAE
ncbi:hypothetical protein [Maricaulis sp. MIT060901]|uniref:hypothetical protein n=1 Tax=Maricaulis sp. MIT060901 TaxID=3096993 RepID=UPI00399B2830